MRSLAGETEETDVLCLGCESQYVQSPTYRLSLATIVLILLTPHHPIRTPEDTDIKSREKRARWGLCLFHPKSLERFGPRNDCSRNKKVPSNAGARPVKFRQIASLEM